MEPAFVTITSAEATKRSPRDIDPLFSFPGFYSARRNDRLLPQLASRRMATPTIYRLEHHQPAPRWRQKPMLQKSAIAALQAANILAQQREDEHLPGMPLLCFEIDITEENAAMIEMSMLAHVV